LESHWKLDRQRGGGIVFHCGIHQLDMIRNYLGPIDEVTAYLPPVNALPYYPADVPDNVTLMLRAKSGAVCNFQIFHNRAPCYYRETNPWSPDWRTIPGHEFDLSLIGTAGSCQMQIYKEKLSLFRFDHAYKDTVLERVEDFGHRPANASHHDMNGMLLAYLRNVAQGRGAIDPASGALETMRLAFAAEAAIARRGAVQVREFE
jgi:predicted dehydrogenase